MVATQVNSGDSGAGDHDYCDDYYFIKSLLEFNGTSTEHSGEGLGKKLGHSPTAWPWPSLVEIVQGVLGRSRLRALWAQTKTYIVLFLSEPSPIIGNACQ